MRQKPWKVDEDLQLKGELMCYTVEVHGRFLWQKGCEVDFGEFCRMEIKTPIHESDFSNLGKHIHGSPVEAKEAVLRSAGFRSPTLGDKAMTFRTSQLGHQIADYLENYRGFDARILNIREGLQFYGNIAPWDIKRIQKEIYAQRTRSSSQQSYR